MPPTTSSRLPIHFDPIRAHRSYGVPDRYEFVPNRRANYLNVFDLASLSFVKEIGVANRPDVTATTIDGRYLYVAGDYLAVVDLETLAVVRTLSGDGISSHYAVNLFPDGERMFIFTYDGSIVVMRHADDPARLAVEKVIVVNQPAKPESAVGGKGHFTADGRRYINANWHTGSVFVMDLGDYSIRTVVPSGFSKPDDLVMALDERQGYTASHSPGAGGNEDAVHVFDIEQGRVLRAIKVGRQPAGLTMSPDSHVVYATNVPDGSVSAIDTASDEVLYTASAAPAYRAAGITGDHLDIEGVTVSADGGTLYAYSVNYGALIVFEALGQTHRARVITGAR